MSKPKPAPAPSGQPELGLSGNLCVIPEAKPSGQTAAQRQAEWDTEFGDHSECPVCGTACEMLFVDGDATARTQALAAQLAEWKALGFENPATVTTVLKVAGDKASALAAQVEDLKACNESLHRLCQRVWTAIEPTGEYEGDDNLVEFSRKIRERAEKAEAALAEALTPEQQAAAAEAIGRRWSDSGSLSYDVAVGTVLAIMQKHAGRKG